MDLQLSGEDTVSKRRKPYTITKERGRWTPQEHEKFLDALKLYGRNWPLIREHVGTKTTLQIRSHAQKFFGKLEKKAHFKRFPRRQAPDIDIPPPHRKRTSADPNPRMTGPASPSSQPEIRDEKLLTPGPSFQTKVMLDFEKEQLHDKSIGEERTTNENENHDNNCSKMGNLLPKESGSIALTDASFFSPMAARGNSCPTEDFLPSKKEVTNGDAKKFCQHNDISKASEFQNKYASVKQLDRAQRCSLPGCEIQPTQNYPSYVAVNSQDGRLRTSLPEIRLKENASSKSRDNDKICIPRSAPNLQTPFIPLCNHTDGYIHASPTFSKHISSALSRNPAAHATASYAAALWPAESTVCNHRCICCMQSKISPGTAAIAGVTVAAASAWWATHGLVPLSVPCHAALNCAPSIGNPVTTDGKAQCFVKSPAQSSVFKPHQPTVSKESMDQNVNGAKKCLDRGKGLLTSEHDDLKNCQIESGKEVSREGQLAFPVLGESSSRQQDAATRETIGNVKHSEGDNVQLSCNVKSGGRSGDQSSKKDKSPNVSEGIITIGLGLGKTSNRQSGFKPYKRS